MIRTIVVPAHLPVPQMHKLVGDRDVDTGPDLTIAPCNFKSRSIPNILHVQPMLKKKVLKKLPPVVYIPAPKNGGVSICVYSCLLYTSDAADE